MAFPTGWGYKWPIAINADSVISSPVADWPCLITDAHFPAGAWAQMQPTGADLRFSLDEAGATELYYDAPRLSVSGESAHLYVGVPSLASGADTTIYGWVGNAEATAPTAAWMQNTYPSDWTAHWPMEEGTGTTVSDRTANANHGTLTNMDPATDWVQAADGSWALDFDGSNDEVACGSFARTFTELSWGGRVETDNHAVHHAPFGAADNVNQGFAWFTYTSPNVRVQLWGSAGKREKTFACDLSGGAHDCMVTYNSVNGATIFYRDGAVIWSGTITAGTITSSQIMRLGRWGIDREDSHWWGPVYSANVNSRILSADEVAIHHLMLSSPATFATAGELVAVGGGVAITITDSLTISERIALQHRLTRRDSLAVADSIVLRHSMTLRDAVAAADAARLTHLTSVTDNIQLREMKRAITPCSGGYFENPSGSCAGAYREDDDQQSNLYQEMV